MEPSAENKRSQRRVDAAIAIRIQGVDSTGQAYDDDATAIEVSRRGLSFLTRRELVVFATLTVVIPGRGPARPGEGPSDFCTEAVVVRATRADGEFNHIGVRFIGATLPMYSAEGV